MLKTIQNSHILKTLSSTLMALLLITSLMTFIPSKRAEAAPAAALVPVVASGLGELLVALGIATVGVGGGYALSEAYPYIKDYFYNLGSDAVDWFNGIPENTYYTDGEGNFYVGNSTDIPLVSPAQLVFKASELPLTWSVPTNFKGTLANIRMAKPGGSTNGGSVMASNVNSYVTPSGSLVWFTPFVRTSSGDTFVGATSFRIGTNENSYYYIDYPETNEVSHPTNGVYEGITVKKGTPVLMGYGSPSWISTGYSIEQGVVKSTGVGYNDHYGRTFPLSSVKFYNSSYPLNGNHYCSFDPSFTSVYTNGNVTPQYNAASRTNGFLVSTEIPKFDLEVDKEKLGDVVISIGGDPQPPDNNSGDDNNENNQNTYSMIPPEFWEVFTTVTDFISKTPSNNTNNGTTLENFVNNNYNYNNVDVDINVPDLFRIRFENPLDINANVNLGGDVTINVNIDDKTELPSVSEGDGENFFSANVIDVFAGLTVNNPVMVVISGLFSAIDPALLAIVSVSISLMLLLALWKLIRG